jgi:hypothetical protein
MTRASNDGSASLFLMTQLELRESLWALGHNVSRRKLTDWRKRDCCRDSCGLGATTAGAARCTVGLIPTSCCERTRRDR